MQADFRNGLLQGTYSAYYSSGQKMGITEYEYGVKHGKSISWHENGNVASEGFFKNGAEDSTLTIYYPNGEKMIETQFENGWQVGVYKEYNEDGSVREEE